jgi:hypothetical protein
MRFHYRLTALDEMPLDVPFAVDSPGRKPILLTESSIQGGEMQHLARVSGFTIVVVGLVCTAVFAAGSDFSSLWVNVDPTGGLTKLNITQLGSDYLVEGFGKCHPTDCEWGATSLRLGEYGIGDSDCTWGVAVLEFGWKSTKLIIRHVCGMFLAITYDVYAPGDPREDRYNIYFLMKP